MYSLFRPYTCLLGRVPHTDIYKDLSVYKVVSTIQNVTLVVVSESTVCISAKTVTILQK